jgi:hypothetical protein
MTKASINWRIKLNLIFPIICIGVFLALAGSVEAATYYADSNTTCANCDGTAPTFTSGTTGPFKTIAQVNSKSFSVGDDIYLKCGSKWTGNVLAINWSGVSENNRSIIGAYYGNGAIGVSGSRPIIYGGESDGYGSVPAKRAYSGLINIGENKSYVTIQDINVQWSGGIGIDFLGGTGNKALRNKTEHTYRSGIRFSGSSYQIVDPVAEYNEVTDAGMSRLDPEDNYSYPASLGFIGGDPTPHSMRPVARYNYVHDNHGEGIGVYKGSENPLLEYNTCVQNRSASLYFDRQTIGGVMRYNLSYGYPGNYVNASGLSFGDEKWSSYGGTTGIRIYGNLIAYSNGGITFANKEGWLLSDVLIANNILIDCKQELNNYNGIGSGYSNVVIKNNIFWRTGLRSDYDSAMGNIGSHTDEQILFSNNYWSIPPDADVRSSIDYGYPSYSNGDPKLEDSSISWNALTLNSLTGAEFALSSNSPCIGRGANLGAPYNHLLNLASSNFKTNIFNFKDQPVSGAWDIGAGVYGTGGDTTTPASPGGLSVR